MESSHRLKISIFSCLLYPLNLQPLWAKDNYIKSNKIS